MAKIRTEESDAAAGQRKRRQFGVLISILASLMAFGSLSIDMYLPAFPQIAVEFDSPVSIVELSLATFLFGFASGQLLYGTAADKFGRKKPLYVGLSLYCLASIACAFAPNVYALIIFRFFQALGACGGIVISRATVRDLFSHNESARVFSLLMLLMGAVPILAPLFGGYFAMFFGWRAIFLLVAVLSSICLIAVFKFLPETKEPNSDIQLGKTFGIYWSIFKDKEFLGFTLAGGLAQAGMFAYITGSPFVFIEIFGVPSNYYGWLFGLNAFGLIGFSQLNSRLLRSFESTQILRVSLTITAIFSTVLILAGVFNFGFWGVVIPIFLYIASLGMIFPNATAGALSQQGDRAGSASALIGTLQYGLGAIASSLVSYFNNGTTLPMTTLIGGCGIVAFLILNLLLNVKKHRQLTVTEKHISLG